MDIDNAKIIELITDTYRAVRYGEESTALKHLIEMGKAFDLDVEAVYEKEEKDYEDWLDQQEYNDYIKQDW